MNRYYPSVAQRADYCCEYCGAPEAGFNLHFEVEHILPRSRGGSDEQHNLALACTACNLYKSNRTAGFDELTQIEVPFFNPREQLWEEHFRIHPTTGEIQGLTAVGRVTIAELRLNSVAQLRARQLWIDRGLYS